jgi:ABC-type taurine transport system substrate-binding protein
MKSGAFLWAIAYRELKELTQVPVDSRPLAEWAVVNLEFTTAEQPSASLTNPAFVSR